MILSSFLSPSAVSASHLCYGGTCHGKNPNTMECGGSYGPIKSLYRNGVKIGKVHNRYSTHCLAQWERTVNLSNNQYAEGRFDGVEVTIHQVGRKSVHLALLVMARQSIHQCMQQMLGLALPSIAEVLPSVALSLLHLNLLLEHIKQIIA